LQTARDRFHRASRGRIWIFARIAVEAPRHERCKSERASGTQTITEETTMSKKPNSKLKLSHETIRVLTSDTVAGVVGGQASGSAGGYYGTHTWNCGVQQEQRRLEDLARPGE
jgi:hypothetical protein